MTREKMISDAEARKIKRLWDSKGDRLGLRNLKTRRTAGSYDRIRLALQPTEVKEAWVKSTITEVFLKLSDMACDVGMSDESFARWFHTCAPELMEPWLEQAAPIAHDAPSVALREYIQKHTHKPQRHHSRDSYIDFEVLRKVLMQDRSPMLVALKASGAKNKNVDAAMSVLLARHGIPESASELHKSDPEFTRSIRYYLKRRRQGALLEDAAQELGLHPESLRWRLRHAHLGQPGAIDVVDECVRLWQEGHSSDGIAQIIGIDPKSAALKVADYAPRPNEV